MTYLIKVKQFQAQKNAFARVILDAVCKDCDCVGNWIKFLADTKIDIIVKI
jgi:hypothetical protein